MTCVFCPLLCSFDLLFHVFRCLLSESIFFLHFIASDIFFNAERNWLEFPSSHYNQSANRAHSLTDWQVVLLISPNWVITCSFLYINIQLVFRFSFCTTRGTIWKFIAYYFEKARNLNFLFKFLWFFLLTMLWENVYLCRVIITHYYMAVSHKDWKLPNSRIWLLKSILNAV